MSVQFIMNASIYAIKVNRPRIKKRKQSLQAVGGTKTASESVHKLLNGQKRKCLHYQISQTGFKTVVNGVRIKLGDERTYTEEMKAAKAEKPRQNASKAEPRVYNTHKKRHVKPSKGKRHGK